MMIATPDLIQRQADLQDSLVQAAHRTWFCSPQVFQCFVLLEESPVVELCDAFEKTWGWRLVTPI
jgi:hypothetical protein